MDSVTFLVIFQFYVGFLILLAVADTGKLTFSFIFSIFFISEAFFPANWEERLRNDLGYFVSSGTLNLVPSIRGQTHETTKS